MEKMSGNKWITRNEIIQKTGIAGPELDEYIEIGILPRPVFGKTRVQPEGWERKEVFPASTVWRVNLVKRLREAGESMETIAGQFRDMATVREPLFTGDKDPKPLGKQSIGLVNSGRKLSSKADKDQGGPIMPDNALPGKKAFPGVDEFSEPVSKPLEGPAHPDTPIKRQIAESLFGQKKSCAAPLCVLAVHLNDLENLSDTMLPEDYFVFVNDIFRSLEICGQKYGAVNGEVGQDMLCFYFFKNPKTEYVLNALQCAARMQKEIASIRRRMRNLTGNAEDVLCLNIGIAEGTEFVGLIHFDQGLTFKALGATPDHAKKLCGFGQGGEIWITQFGMGKLPAKDVKTLSFGVHRMDAAGRIHHMPNMFAKVKDIFREGIEPSRWEDISHLPVTRVSEILD